MSSSLKAITLYFLIFNQFFVIKSDRESRVHYGTNASSGPWMVSVRANPHNTYEEHFCGGTILTPSWILTAAHCVRYASTVQSIKYGSLDLKNDEKVVEVKRQIIHPEFKFDYAKNDIALLELKENLTLEENVAEPVRIPCKNWELPPPFYSFECNLKVSMYGWGLKEDNSISDNLLKINGSLYAATKCNELNEHLRDVTEKEICGKGFYPSGICRGDSGGPLMIEDERGAVQIGIISSALEPKCSNTTKPGFYTKISSHTQWIQDHIGENFTCVEKVLPTFTCSAL